MAFERLFKRSRQNTEPDVTNQAESMLICDCGEKISNQAALDEHKTNNCPKRGFVCEFCDERLSTSNDLGYHLYICGSKTNQCPQCKKYIQRSIFAYHTANNCNDFFQFDEETEATSSMSYSNRLVNSASQHMHNTDTSKKFESLFNEATHVHQTLAEKYFQSEVNYVAEKLQFNIIIMGSPRVGKSSLINALCDGKNPAETSPSLNSCTKEIKCYFLEDNQQRNPEIKPFKINFYDTPGIESWTDESGQKTMIKIIEEINPVCFIFCASPGSFADLKQLHPVLEFCKEKQIFCALVCTNMWSGNNRDVVIREFENELEFFGDKIEKFSNQPYYRTPHKVTFFGQGALCTMVNSMEYYDKDFFDRRMPAQGIDELIHGIMDALDHEKLLGWCYAVLYRRTYWEKITQNIGGFFSLRFANLYNLAGLSPEGVAANFAADLYERVFKRKT